MKQESIDKIDAVLKAWYAEGGCEGTLGPDRKTAEALYDRIAPLQEFPEEGVLQELQWLYSTGSLDGANKDQFDATIKYKVNIALRIIKALCEGSPRPAEGDNILEQECPTCKGEPYYDDAGNPCPDCTQKAEQDKPKGTCRKCGGSGRRPLTALGRIGYCPNLKRPQP